MSRAEARRFDCDELRELAATLLKRLGVPASAANTLSRVLLWYDQAGRPSLGLGGLGRWLERIQAAEFELQTRGRLTLERAGALRINGEQGLPPVVLEHALEVVLEKARDLGVGCARVENLAAGGLLSALVFEATTRPFSALIAGPGPVLVHGYARMNGEPPSLVDSSLVLTGPGFRSELNELAPWEALAGPGGWLVMAWNIAEDSAMPFDRVMRRGGGEEPPAPGRRQGSGRIDTEQWTLRQAQFHQAGVPLEPAAIRSLQTWCARLDVLFPGEKAQAATPMSAPNEDLTPPTGR